MTIEAEERRQRWLRRPPWWVFLIAVGVMGLMLITTTEQVRGTSGGIQEKVTALSAKKHHPIEGCGRGDGVARDITWESENSPGNLPAVFETKGICRWEAGDKTTAVRELRDDGTVKKTWFDPTTTYWSAIGITLGAGLVIFLIYYLLRGFRLVWLRYFWHD